MQTASSDCDILTDAAEEISFAHSERTESHKLDERKVEQHASLQLPTIDAIRQYLDQPGKGDQQGKLEAFVEGLKRREHRGERGGQGGQSEVAARAGQSLPQTD